MGEETIKKFEKQFKRTILPSFKMKMCPRCGGLYFASDGCPYCHYVGDKK